MKFGKGTAAAVWNSSVSDGGSASTAQITAANWALLLYKGTVPSLSDFNTAMNSVNYQDTSTTSREPYLNLQDLVAGRSGDYLGGVTGQKRFDVATLDLNKIALRLNAVTVGNPSVISQTGSGRATVIMADGTPTWFALVQTAGAYINLTAPMGGTAALTTLAIVGTVGDETSSADLRIKGGKVYANNSDYNQTRSLNISDLILTLN